MTLLRVALGLAAALALSWLVFVAVLAIVRPRGIDLHEATRLVPDVARLVKDLARDHTLPRGVRTRLVILGVYLALPFDLVPDFLPVVGYADDVIVVAIVLRAVVRRAGADAVRTHWHGTAAGLAFVSGLAGIDNERH